MSRGSIGCQPGAPHADFACGLLGFSSRLLCALRALCGESSSRLITVNGRLQTSEGFRVLHQTSPPTAICVDARLQAIFQTVADWVFRLGGIGLFAVGVVDSSILMAPLANDLLVVALAATHPHRMWYYGFMAAAGSTARLCDYRFLEPQSGTGHAQRHLQQTLQVRRKAHEETSRMDSGAGTVIPPPFPFTPFVAMAAGSGYARKKLLTIVFVARFVRFAAEGLLALKYGKGILGLAKAPAVEYTIVALIVIAVVGSAISIFRWVHQGKSATHGAHRAAEAS